MIFLLADDSKESPYNTPAESCEKCQHTRCFSLHDYTATSCPYQTCGICLDLEKLDAQILNVHNLLLDLSKKRCDLKGKINHLHDRFIHHLPIEIVSHVFAFFVESNERQYIKSNRSYQWSPSLILGAVCRRWRGITLGIPQMWTKVTIDPWKHALSLDVTREWLGRSRALPLSLTIKGTELLIKTSLQPPTLLLQNIFQLLRSHSGRWRSLTLEVPSSIVHRMLNGLEGVLHVDVLRIDAADCIGTEMELIAMQHSLIPTELYARNISLAKIPLHWDKLTCLDVYLISVDELLHILCHATNLQTCIANVIKPDEGNYSLPTHTASIVNNSLKSLDTQACDFEANFLRYLTLPALESLKYRFPNHYDEAINILANFLDRSEPSLGNFSFTYHVDELYEIEDWYVLPPTITYLELKIEDPGNFVEEAEDFFFALGLRDEPLIFPCLRELRIVTPNMSRENWELLGESFPENDGKLSVTNTSEAEGRSTRPLELVSIHLQTQWNDEETIMDDYVYFRLLEIQQSGVQIKVVDINGTDLLQASAELYENDSVDEEGSDDDGSGGDGTEEDLDDNGSEGGSDGGSEDGSENAGSEDVPEGGDNADA